MSSKLLHLTNDRTFSPPHPTNTTSWDLMPTHLTLDPLGILLVPDSLARLFSPLISTSPLVFWFVDSHLRPFGPLKSRNLNLRLTPNPLEVSLIPGVLVRSYDPHGSSKTMAKQLRPHPRQLVLDHPRVSIIPGSSTRSFSLSNLQNLWKPLQNLCISFQILF